MPYNYAMHVLSILIGMIKIKVKQSGQRRVLKNDYLEHSAALALPQTPQTNS